MCDPPLSRIPCAPQMAAVKPAGKPGLEEDAAPIHRIRITLTSRNTAALEKGANGCTCRDSALAAADAPEHILAHGHMHVQRH